MRRVTSSSAGSINGRRTISPRVESASLRFAATRSRSDRAAMPANWSPDFSSLALANSSRRSQKLNCSIIGRVPTRTHHLSERGHEQRASKIFNGLPDTSKSAPCQRIDDLQTLLEIPGYIARGRFIQAFLKTVRRWAGAATNLEMALGGLLNSEVADVFNIAIRASAVLSP